MTESTQEEQMAEISPEINMFRVCATVGPNGEQGIHIGVTPLYPIAKAYALNLAAYLVALAEEEPGEFQRVLEAVRGT